MARLPPSHILVRIVLAAGVAFTLIMVTGSLWTIYTHADLVREEQMRSVGMIARGLSNAVAQEMVTEDYGALENRLRQTLSLPGVSSALVTDLDGRLLSRVERTGPGDEITVSYGPATLLTPDASHLVTTTATQGSVGWQRIEVGVPLGWVRVETTNAHIKDVNARVQRNTLYLAILGTLIVAGLLIDALLRASHRLRSRESEVELTETRLSAMAYFDRLTGLPNRILLLDRMHQVIARSKRDHNLVAVCFVDLDGFKPVNDRYGHNCGDQLLKLVAQRLLAGIREGDTAARYGGDEFVLLLDGLSSREECGSILDRLLGSLAEPYDIADRFHTISASIGVTLYPIDAGDADQLIAHADQAMYGVKQAGGYGFDFHPAAGSGDMAGDAPDETGPAAGE